MHIHKKDLIATIKLNAEEINLDTVNQLLKDPTLKPNHIIIHLEGVTELDEEQLDALFYFSEMVRAEGEHSFVVVYEHIACPTLQEALDIIEMEEIERDLFDD